MTDTLEKGFNYFKIYRGVQLHCQPGSKYSFNVYGPLNRGTDPNKFEVSPDRFTYIKLSKRMPRESDFVSFLSFAFLKFGKIPYIRQLASEPLIREWESEFQKKKLSLRYEFDLAISGISASDLRTDGQSYPRILERCLLSDEIFVDIFAILDIILHLADRYAVKFQDDLFLCEKLNKYQVYRKLLSFTGDDIQYYKEKVNKLVTRKT